MQKTPSEEIKKKIQELAELTFPCMSTKITQRGGGDGNWTNPPTPINSTPVPSRLLTDQRGQKSIPEASWAEAKKIEALTASLNCLLMRKSFDIMV